ncbi:MAG TPA: VOC family protein [Acidimicrobiia bacterium]
MPDPLEQLRAPIDPVAPSPSFRRALRDRIRTALGVDPIDVVVDVPGRSPTMTTTTPETATGTARVAAITPYLTVHDAAAAIEFYAAAFDGVEDFRVVGDDGKLGHAEMRIGEARIQLSDEYPEIEVRSPRSLGGSGVGLSLTVDDCDAVWQQALDAGAEGLRPPEDQPHGNRMAVLRDPFGHRWFLLQPLEAFDLAAYAERSASTEFDVVAGPGATRRTALDGVWPALHYRDADAAIRFVVDVLGFEELIVVRGEPDPSIVHHSELRWPEGGIVQIATAHREGNIYSRAPGLGSLYVITLDPESVLARCEAADAEIIDPLREVDYGVAGDRMFTVRDAEGNLWCFGTYGATR